MTARRRRKTVERKRKNMRQGNGNRPTPTTTPLKAPDPAAAPAAESKPAREYKNKKGLVTRYLVDHPNIDVHYGQIAAETGLTEREVSQTVWHIQKGHGGTLNVQRVGTGVLRYTPGPPETEREATSSALMYEQRGVAGNGDHIIEDTNGVLYRATPL